MYYIQNKVSPHFFYYPAEFMLNKGFDVEVLTRLYPERNESAYEVNNGIKVRRFPRSRTRFCTSLLRFMLKNDYSLVHLHSVGFLEDYVPWIVSRTKRTPLVFTCHDSDLLNWLESSREMKARIVRKGLKMRNSEKSVFIAFTESQANLYRSCGLKSIKVIPHGIDPAVFDAPKDYRVAEKYHLGENNILCVGSLEPRKGQHILIEALPTILGCYPKLKLLLVGRVYPLLQEEYKKQLELKIGQMGLERNVVFLNDVSREELIQLYLLSDVFAFPTAAEAFGLVFLEAMAAGLPVVSTDRPIVREILQNGDAGILVRREQKHFADGIISLLGDRGLRSRLIENGRKAVEEKYSLRRVIEKLGEVYQSLIGQRI